MATLIAWGPEMITFYNDACAPVLAGRPDPLGRSFPDAFPEAWPKLAPLMRRAQAGQASFHEDYPVALRRDDQDEERFWTFSYSPIFDETGQTCGVLCVFVETTHRKQTEDRLRLHDTLFKAFTESEANAIWVVDVESGTAMFQSTAVQGIWGMPGASAMTWDAWLRSLYPDDRGRLADALDRLGAGEVLNEDYRILRPDGEIRSIRATMFPIVSDDGIVRRVGSICQDVTRRSRAVVHLIDHDPVSRAGRSAWLYARGFDVRCFASVDAFLKVHRALLPGCVIHQPGEIGTEIERMASALKPLRHRFPLLLIADMADVRRAIDLMKAGIADIFPRQVDEDRLAEAITATIASMARDAEDKFGVDPSARQRVDALSIRERQVLEQLVSGATNKIIARELNISPRTVETHRLRLMERLGVSNYADAIRLAAQAGVGRS